MILFAVDSARAQRLVAGALVGGIAGGALVPTLLTWSGPLAARAALAATIAAATLVARRGSSVPARVAVAAGFGLFAAAVEGIVHGGPATALLGLGFGLAVAPEGLHGGIWKALARASAAGAGALMGSIAVASCAGLQPLASLTAPGWGAVLGGAIGLGAGLGEAIRAHLVTAERVPAEVAAARPKLSQETRPLLDAASNAYSQVIESLRGAKNMPGADKLETLSTARELARATARDTLAIEELSRTIRALGAQATNAEPYRRRDQVRTQAQESVAALTELALAIADRTTPAQLEDEGDLAARARGLAIRLGRDPAAGKA